MKTLFLRFFVVFLGLSLSSCMEVLVELKRAQKPVFFKPSAVETEALVEDTIPPTQPVEENTSAG